RSLRRCWWAPTPPNGAFGRSSRSVRLQEKIALRRKRQARACARVATPLATCSPAPGHATEEPGRAHPPVRVACIPAVPAVPALPAVPVVVLPWPKASCPAKLGRAFADEEGGNRRSGGTGIGRRRRVGVAGVGKRLQRGGQAHLDRGALGRLEPAFGAAQRPESRAQPLSGDTGADG